jgi:hypothetical protein
LAAQLKLLVAEWVPATSGGEDGEFVLKRLEQAFQNRGRYSLESERTSDQDPILDFLEHNTVGHCEYFASAFALMVRALGFPSRVIAGYRVAEESPFGYAIVRRSHAHAWAEVWVDNRWRTFDPTPPAALAAHTSPGTPWLAALWDQSRTSLAALDDWFASRSTFEILLSLLVLGALWTLERLRRSRGESLEEATTQQVMLEGLALLSKALEDRGLTRRQAETLSALAKRAGAARLSAEEQRSVVLTLHAYVAYRYGGVGDRNRVDQQMRALSAALRRGSYAN